MKKTVAMLVRSALLCTTALIAIAPTSATAKQAATPIQHLIVIVGENKSFDHLFGMYVPPKSGQTVDNLYTSRIYDANGNVRPGRILNADGSRGPDASYAAQNYYNPSNINDKFRTYQILTPNSGPYLSAGGMFKSPIPILDGRYHNPTTAGLFQYTKYIKYTGNNSFDPAGSDIADPAHRFFQAWQQWNGGLNDKFVWVAMNQGNGWTPYTKITGGWDLGTDTVIAPDNAPFFGANQSQIDQAVAKPDLIVWQLSGPGVDPKLQGDTVQGAASMGYYNMQTGDAPAFKALADGYALSDNFHVSVKDGTGVNFFSIVTGHLPYYTDPNALNGAAATPQQSVMENPDPIPGYTVFYRQDGDPVSVPVLGKIGLGTAFVNCSDNTQPGVAAIL